VVLRAKIYNDELRTQRYHVIYGLNLTSVEGIDRRCRVLPHTFLTTRIDLESGLEPLIG
jgi:hypothetical protein